MYKEDRLFTDIMIDIKTIENASTITNQRKRKRDSSNVPDDEGWVEFEDGWYNVYGEVTVNTNPYE